LRLLQDLILTLQDIFQPGFLLIGAAPGLTPLTAETCGADAAAADAVGLAVAGGAFTMGLRLTASGGTTGLAGASCGTAAGAAIGAAGVAATGLPRGFSSLTACFS
jgi:hypothetical protein